MTDNDTTPIEPLDDGPRGRWDEGPPWAAVGAAVLALAVIILIAYLVMRDGDDDVTTDPVTSSSTTTLSSTTVSPSTTATATTTSAPTSTSAATTTPATTTSSPATTTTTVAIEPTVYASAVWPWANSTTRYDDPIDAARGFAEDFAGYTAPVLGEFMQGDNRSGEVEIRPVADGPASTVFVRQLGPDDTWWVLGAATANIVVDQPNALDVIGDPLTVSGQSLAFEGTVVFHIRADGADDPLFSSFVTGGGSELAPFSSTFDWDQPNNGAGALLFFTESAENGQVWEVGVLRVAFAEPS